MRVQSGYPWAPIANVRLPNARTQNVFVDNIDNRRADNAALLDLRVDSAIKVAGEVKVTDMLDVYNVTNSNAVTNFSSPAARRSTGSSQRSTRGRSSSGSG